MTVSSKYHITNCRFQMKLLSLSGRDSLFWFWTFHKIFQRIFQRKCCNDVCFSTTWTYFEYWANLKHCFISFFFFSSLQKLELLFMGERSLISAELELWHRFNKNNNRKEEKPHKKWEKCLKFRNLQRISICLHISRIFPLTSYENGLSHFVNYAWYEKNGWQLEQLKWNAVEWIKQNRKFEKMATNL